MHSRTKTIYIVCPYLSCNYLIEQINNKIIADNIIDNAFNIMITMRNVGSSSSIIKIILL